MLSELLDCGRRELCASGIESSALDARLLLQHATGLDHAALVAADRRSVTTAERTRYEGLIARRAARVPLAYIVGAKEFWGRDFIVSPGVLVPRPETEHLIEATLNHFLPRLRGRRTTKWWRGKLQQGPPPSLRDTSPASGGGEKEAIRILDLGTGSGVLLITVLCEIANAWGVGVDRSESAIAIARDNAARHGVYDRAHFLVGDWAAPLAARFDLIVANPPYLTTAELACAAPELAAEPAGALDGGEDGLNAYRAILLKLEALMAPGALAVLEIGAGQGAVLGALAGARGLESGAAGRDLAGHERVLTMSRGGAA